MTKKSCFSIVSLCHNICIPFLFWWFLTYLPLNMQCYEGKPIFEFERTRMLRSGLVGFALHGSLSHYYYQFCEVIIFFHIFLFVGFPASGWNSIAFACRLFSLSRIGGWSLPKFPLTKQFGRQFGTVYTISSWGSCVLNPQPIFWASWRQHFGPCWP